MRDWLTESDEWLSPQAAVLSPAATYRIADAIVAETTPYKRTLAAGLEAVRVLRDGVDIGRLTCPRKRASGSIVLRANSAVRRPTKNACWLR